MNKKEQISGVFDTLCKEAELVTGVDIRKHTGRVRPRSITTVRAAVCNTMLNSGYSMLAISDAAGIDRNSIRNYRINHDVYVTYQDGYLNLYKRLMDIVTPYELIDNPLIKLTAEL